jgi:hypothetical protein
MFDTVFGSWCCFQQNFSLTFYFFKHPIGNPHLPAQHLPKAVHLSFTAASQWNLCYTLLLLLLLLSNRSRHLAAAAVV